MTDRIQTIRAALTGGALALVLAGCNQTPFSYYGGTLDRADTPGVPRSHVLMERRLIEDGHEPRGPIRQLGAVYFIEVETLRDHQRRCLVLHAFSGVILQSLRVGPTGWIAEIGTSPGPGYPGYPPVPDGRYAPLCEPILQAAASDPLVIPGVGPEVLRVRY